VGASVAAEVGASVAAVVGASVAAEVGASVAAMVGGSVAGAEVAVAPPHADSNITATVSIANTFKSDFISISLSKVWIYEYQSLKRKEVRSREASPPL
jgi:hypothetical protein